MTLASEAQVARPWRRRLPWILLALSVALNLFFVGGLVWTKIRAERWGGPGGMRIERLADELRLGGEQRQALERFLAETRANGRRLGEANRPLMQAYWGELATPAADAQKLAAITDDVAANRQAFQRAMTDSLLRFLATLPPEQRTAFAERMRQRGEGPRGRRGPPLP